MDQVQDLLSQSPCIASHSLGVCEARSFLEHTYKLIPNHFFSCPNPSHPDYVVTETQVYTEPHTVQTCNTSWSFKRDFDLLKHEQ